MKVYLLDGLWGRHWRLMKLAKKLYDVGLDSEIWTYDSSGRSKLSTLAEHFLAEAQNNAFAAVGYSMGGLILREAMRLNPNLPLQKIVFLNTPHAGSLVANFFGFLGSGIRDMQPKSPFLKKLHSSSLGQHCHATLTVWTPGDLMVIPARSASFEKGNTAEQKESIRSKVPAHIWPIYSQKLQQKIVHFLAPDFL
ncbi:MAG: esterase/lipase family protein [Chthoniobacterales bacterium]